MPPYTLVRPFLRTSQGFLFDFGGPDYDGDGNPVSPGNFEVNIDPSGFALVENPDGTLTVTVTAPAAYAGLYENIDVTTILDAPIEIYTPASTGTLGTGEVITGLDPLFFIAEGRTASISYQWQRDTGGGFGDISGATGATLTALQNDTAGTVRRVNTVSDGTGSTPMESPGVVISSAIYDPSTSGTIISYYDPSDTASVTHAAGTASAIADQTANNVDLVDNGNEPDYDAGSTITINGLSAVQTANDTTNGEGFVTTGSFPLDIGTSDDIVIAQVLDVTGANTGFSPILRSVGASSEALLFWADNTGTYGPALSQANFTGFAASPTVGNSAGPHVAIAALDSTAGTATIYIDGVQVGQATDYTGGLDQNQEFGWMVANAGDSIGAKWGELILDTGVSKVQAMNTYLSTKWGIGYDPATSTTVAAYYDPSDTASVTHSAGAATAITDQTSNNVDLVKTGGTDDVDYDAGSTIDINGLAAFQTTSSGVGSGMWTGGVTGIDIGTSGDLVVAMVLDITDGNTDFAGGIRTTAGGAGANFQLRVGDAVYQPELVGGGATAVTGSLGNAYGPHVAMGVFDWSASTMTLYIDNAQVAQATNYTNQLDADQVMQWMVNEAFENTASGKYGGLIFEKDINQARGVTAYLMNKWGIS